jgi:hypothetical protein
VTPVLVTPAQAGVQSPTGFLLARENVEKRRFLRASAFSFGESAELGQMGQIENSCSSGELIVSVWF